ncbi:tyrosine-protein kinase receptor, partial [Plakobranchus ocellatus]
MLQAKLLDAPLISVALSRCHTGCNLYESAISTSCQKVCLNAYQQTSHTSGHQSLGRDEIRNCVRGCLFALEKYSSQVQEELGELARPQLLISSLSHSSLTLKWDTRLVANVTFKVHKRMLDWDSGWHLHAFSKFLPNKRIELTGLQPYVTYKFKVVALISSLPKYIQESNETGRITTTAHGKPSTAPQIRYVTTPSPTVISLAWIPPRFTNNELLGYRIHVQAIGGEEGRLFLPEPH